jgi:hypothetical protein
VTRRAPRPATPVLRAVAVLLSLVLPCLVPLPGLPALLVPGFSAAAEKPAAIVDQPSFEAWLTATGRHAKSRYHAYPANFATYRDFDLLVYGTPSQVANNAYDAVSRQYRYLGFSYDEFAFSNTFYPPDAPVGDPQSTPWQWTGSWQEIALGTDAAVSWLRLTAREKEHVKASVLYYSGSSYGGMTFGALGLSEQNTVVLSPPSWTLGFALFTKHYWGTGNLRYATFTGKGIGDVTVGCVLEETARPADGVYTIPATGDTVRIPVRVTGRITAYGGLARAGDVARLGASAGSAVVEGTGAADAVASGWIEVARSQLDGAATKRLTLTGTAWAVSILGDPVFAAATLEVTVADGARNADPFLSLEIVGDVGYFRGQKDLLGRTVDRDPMRFLGLETVTVTATFSRTPDRVVFTPVGPLLATDYRDPFGNLYALSRFGRRSLLYPADFTVVPTPGQTRVAFRYRLPLVPSTVSWEGRALREAYRFEVRADLAGSSTVRSLSGIGITGDIFDVLHLQPVP